MAEYSIVKWSYVKSSLENRMEAEYYSPRFLELEKKLLSYSNTCFFGEIAKYCNGCAYSSEKISTDGDIPLARIADVTNKRSVKDWGNVSIDEFSRLKGEFLQEVDILMGLTGDPPDVGKVLLFHNKNNIKATHNQRTTRILSKRPDLSQEFLFAILSSELVRTQIERVAKGVRQRNVGTEGLKSLLIPIPWKLSKIIETIIKEYLLNLYQSEALYSEAEKYLISELGFDNWRPKFCLSFVKNYSDIEGATRVDAEYFQPKYDEIITHIKKYKGGWATLQNIANIKDKNFSPKDETCYKYIELGNIGSNGWIEGCTKARGQDLPSRARRKVLNRDLIVSSVQGSLTSIALISGKYDKALCSTGFYVIDSADINPETLLCLLKSTVFQLQLQKGCSGTILSAINKDEFSKIILPKIRGEIQKSIKVYLTKSFIAKSKSHQLLEIAKRGVEVAIEKDEETAKAWIEGEKRKLEDLD